MIRSTSLLTRGVSKQGSRSSLLRLKVFSHRFGATHQQLNAQSYSHSHSHSALFSTDSSSLEGEGTSNIPPSRSNGNGNGNGNVATNAATNNPERNRNRTNIKMNNGGRGNQNQNQRHTNNNQNQNQNRNSIHNNNKSNNNSNNNNGSRRNNNNPWSNVKKTSVPAKSEERIANALRNNRNHQGSNSNSHGNSNNNRRANGNGNGNQNPQAGNRNSNNNSNNNQRKGGITPSNSKGNNSKSNGNPPPLNRFRKTSTGSNSGIEKLREAFMQTLSADRERRQANANSNPNTTKLGSNTSTSSNPNKTLSRPSNDIQTTTESRLDQLLRMSKQKPQRDQNNNQTNRPFRGRSQNGNGNRNQPQNPNGQGNGFNLNRTNTYHNNYHNNNNYYSWRDRNQNQYQSNEPTAAQLLQKELMKDNQLAQNNNAHNSDPNHNAQSEKEVVLPNRNLSILQLSSILRIQKEKLIQALRELGESPPRKGGLDQDGFKVDVDMAELVAMELGLEPTREKRDRCSMEAAESRMRRQSQEEDGLVSLQEDELYETYPPRPPVVCIMGHVDHGKTTLMDCLRQKAAEAGGGGNGGAKKNKKKSKKNKKKGKGGDDGDGNVSNVAGTEAGGITQVVSAFQIQLPGGSSDGIGNVDAVTFLDTPGHAAFKAMRQSGSNGADVIVLVVAADDGVSPQTVEIIDMYKSIARAQPGSISMVVAMTKIDKPGIDIEESTMRIENQLMEHEIFSERMALSDSEFDAVPMFPLSGMTGEGLGEMIEGLILQSEVMDLRACKDSRAEGLIIDAKVENGLGVVADCIIRWGKLEPGDYVLSGVHGGKVRILNDVNNKSVKRASPSQPIRIVGLKSLPKAGDPIVCVKSEEIAKALIAKREAILFTNDTSNSYRADDSKAKLDVIVTGGASKKGFMANNVLKRFGLDAASVKDEVEDEQIRIPVLLKADADGTLAALRDTLLAIQDESKLDLCIDPVEVSIGHVTPTDVNLAAESGAAIFCFNLKGTKDKTAMSLAASNNVEIRSHDVIYHLLDEAKDVFASYCPATPVEKIHGVAKVQAVFDINNNKDAERVAGLMVNEGRLYLDKFKSDSGSLDCEYRIKRDKRILVDGLKAKSLRREKEEVKDVRRGEECGLNLLDYIDVEEGDIIECYSVEMKRMFV